MSILTMVNKVKEYVDVLKENSLKNNPNIKDQLPELIYDVNEFFFQGIVTGLFDEKNLERILDSLNDPENGLKAIDFLPPELSGVYGRNNGTTIEINSDFETHLNSPDLTAKEIRRLYLFHEMGHKILHIRDNGRVINDYISTLKPVLEEKGMVDPNLDKTNFIDEGFAMIEECLTQELAEILTYKSVKKERPKYQQRIDSKLQCEFSSNLDYYGIFQMPTIELGRTIRGCSSDGTNDRILFNMIKKALDTDFDLELISEYYKGSKDLYFDLANVLKAMGFLKVKKYSTFGQGTNNRINTKSILDSIEKITERNKDYRDRPKEGYEPIDFSKYKSKLKK